MSGQAFSFSGNGGGVSIPPSRDIHGNVFSEKTISLWFKASEEVLPTQVLWTQGTSYQGGLTLYIHKSKVYVGAWNFALWSGMFTTEWGAVYVSQAIEPHTFYHVVLVLDGTNEEVRGYLNGAKFGEANGAGELGAPQSTKGADGYPKIGGGITRIHDGTSAGQSFKGLIDEVEHYNRVLSDAEIKSIYEAVSSGRTRVLVP